MSLKICHTSYKTE